MCKEDNKQIGKKEMEVAIQSKILLVGSLKWAPSILRM